MQCHTHVACNFNLGLTTFTQIAGKVAAPLSRTNEIVILSGEGNRVTGEVNRLLAELPVSVNALTGVDLTKVRMFGVPKAVPRQIYGLITKKNWSNKPHHFTGFLLLC